MTHTSSALRRTGRVVGLALSVGVAACALNPATGRRQLSLIGEAQEVQMGREAARSVRSTLGFVDNETLQSYVRKSEPGKPRYPSVRISRGSSTSLTIRARTPSPFRAGSST